MQLMSVRGSMTLLAAGVMLAVGCHDVPGEQAQMCHDIGHEGDDVACEKAYAMCLTPCNL